MMAALRIPVLLIGGEADRLVPVAGVREAGARNPEWDTVVLADVGHTPQLEAPDAVIGTVRGWLGAFTRRAELVGRSARPGRHAIDGTRSITPGWPAVRRCRSGCRPAAACKGISCAR